MAGSIDHLAEGCIAGGERHESGAGIGHVVEITGRREGAQTNLALTCCDLANDRWNHGTGTLTGAVGVEGTQNGHEVLKTAPVAQSDLIGADLAGGVGRLAHQGMVFQSAQTAVPGFRCGCVHPAAPPDPEPLAHHIEGAMDVCVDILAGATWL